MNKHKIESFLQSISDSKFSRLIDVSIKNKKKFTDNNYKKTFEELQLKTNQPKVGNTHSIYVGYVDKLCVFDFDYMNKKNWNDVDEADKQKCDLYNLLIGMQCPYTNTTKGQHFYLYINDFPEYSCNTNVYVQPYFGIDFFGNDRFNIWEKTNCDVFNGGAIPTFEYSQIKPFLNLTRMKIDKPPKKPIVNININQLDLHRNESELFNYHLDDRLLKRIRDNLDLNTRSDWLKYSTICKRNGYFEHWDEVSKQYDNYNFGNNIKEWNKLNTNIPIIESQLSALAYRDTALIKMKMPPQKQMKPNITFDEKYLGKALEKQLFALDETKNYIFKSDKGTGKTTLVSKYFAEGNKKFISIVSRKNLGLTQYVDMSLKGVKNLHYYDDTSPCELYGNENLIVTIDSLTKFIDVFDDYLEEYHFFFDEFQSMITHQHTSKTMDDKRITSWNAFIDIFKRCKQWICVDADIRDISFMIPDELGCEYTYIENTFKANRGIASKECEASELIDRLVKDVKSNQKWFLCCDSKTKAEQLHEEVIARGCDNVMLVTSKSNANFVKFDDEKWVIYSPKVVYGLDFQLKRNVYCYYTCATLTPSNFLQQVSRCRNIQHLYYTFENHGFQQPFYKKEQDVLEDVKLLREYSYRTILKNLQWHTQKLYTKVFVKIIYMVDCFNTNKRAHFKHLLREDGFIDENVSHIDKKKCKIKVDKELLRQKNIDNFDINDEANERKNNILKLNDEQVEEYMDYFIDDFKLEQHFSVCRYFLNEKSLNDRVAFRDDFTENLVRSSLNKTRELQALAKLYTLKVDENQMLSVTIPETTSQRPYEDYKLLFRIRAKTALDMANKRDVLVLFSKYFKGIFGKDIMASKQVTIESKKQRNYYLQKQMIDQEKGLWEIRQPKEKKQKQTKSHLLDEIGDLRYIILNCGEMQKQILNQNYEYVNV